MENNKAGQNLMAKSFNINFRNFKEEKNKEMFWAFQVVNFQEKKLSTKKFIDSKI